MAVEGKTGVLPIRANLTRGASHWQLAAQRRGGLRVSVAGCVKEMAPEMVCGAEPLFHRDETHHRTPHAVTQGSLDSPQGGRAIP
jgi:hypothetical protein